jgi:hypothetical protein
MPARITPLATLRCTLVAMPNDQALHQARRADSESAVGSRTTRTESEGREKRKDGRSSCWGLTGAHHAPPTGGCRCT